jgi:hypothetical protein
VGDDENLGGLPGVVDELDEGGIERWVETVLGFVENEKRGGLWAQEGGAEG